MWTTGKGRKGQEMRESSVRLEKYEVSQWVRTLANRGISSHQPDKASERTAHQPLPHPKDEAAAEH